jgi:nucleolar MIF4G domain-containing protein 1
LIGPGGKGLKRDRDDSDSEDDEDDDLDLDLEHDSDEDEEEDEDEDSDMYDTDPNDLDEKHGRPREPSELYDGDDRSDQGDAKIDLSEDEPTEEQEDEEPAEAAAATKYVPPHMRATQLAEKAQGSKEKALGRQKLERKLQGLLNK